MIDSDQRGWKFEPYEEDDDTRGYFTFRFGGPLYGIVEQEGVTWSAHVFLEESDEWVTTVMTHTTEEIARQAVINSIISILATWQEQFESVVTQLNAHAGTNPA